MPSGVYPPDIRTLTNPHTDQSDERGIGLKSVGLDLISQLELTTLEDLQRQHERCKRTLAALAVLIDAKNRLARPEPPPQTASIEEFNRLLAGHGGPRLRPAGSNGDTVDAGSPPPLNRDGSFAASKAKRDPKPQKSGSLLAARLRRGDATDSLDLIAEFIRDSGPATVIEVARAFEMDGRSVLARLRYSDRFTRGPDGRYCLNEQPIAEPAAVAEPAAA